MARPFVHSKTWGLQTLRGSINNQPSLRCSTTWNVDASVRIIFTRRCSPTARQKRRVRGCRRMEFNIDGNASVPNCIGKSAWPANALFLFSNTNVIHANVFEAWMEKRFGLSAFRGSFEGIHYSHEMGQRKPDPQAFLSLCSRHRIDPNKAIFIDDSEQHVEGARQAGLEVNWHHPVEKDVAVWLSARGFELPEEAFRSGPLPV